MIYLYSGSIWQEICVWPNFAGLLQLFFTGLAVALFGAWLFEKSRKGFADVL